MGAGEPYNGWAGRLGTIGGQNAVSVDRDKMVRYAHFGGHAVVNTSSL